MKRYSKYILMIFIFQAFFFTGLAQNQSNLFFIFLNTNPDRENLPEAESRLLVETSPIHNIDKFKYTLRKLWTAEGTFCRKGLDY